jgi:hypothetical protein
MLLFYLKTFKVKTRFGDKKKQQFLTTPTPVYIPDTTKSWYFYCFAQQIAALPRNFFN